MNKSFLTRRFSAFNQSGISIKFVSTGSSTLTLLNEGGNAPYVEYSYDNKHWTVWDYSALTFDTNGVHLRGKNTSGFSESGSKYSHFTLSGDNVSCEGNVMSLINYSKNVKTVPCSWCFYGLFVNCDKLTTAPELLAITLTESCYSNMFSGCSALTYIKCYAENVSVTDCLNNWVDNVAATGTFIKKSMATYSTGVSGIPTGWTVLDYTERCLTFSCDNNQTICIENNGGNNPNVEYSFDKMTWNTLSTSPITFGGSTSSIYVRGYNPTGFSTNYNKYTKFVFGNSNPVSCSGNVMHLIDYNQDITTIPCSYCYYYMFYGCTSLTTAPELPATTLAGYCYYYMFYGCTSLTTAPELPATNLAGYCYYYMFYGCTSLTTAPELPATTLVDRCYTGMFNGCTSLTTAPELPATTLANYCYYSMFDGCTSLNYIKCLAEDISASNCLKNWTNNVSPTGTFIKKSSTTFPTGSSGIPTNWTVLNYNERCLAFACDNNQTICINNNGGNNPNVEYSFDYIHWNTLSTSPITFTGSIYVRGYNPTGFSSSSSKYTKFVFGNSNPVSCSGNVMHLIDYNQDITTIPCSYCYNHMFSGCTSLTTAPELPATTLASYCYNSMFSGCTSLTTAPELPATTLANYCYYSMFNGCTSLNYIKCLAEDISASYCLFAWTYNVSPTGTFIKKSSTTFPTGPFGIPSNWTIQNI